MELAPGSLFGKYRLEARLGGGSFGSVWRATDSETDMVVALKILAGSYEESDAAKLRTDVELLAAAAGASSAHVVRVLEGGLEPSAHVVMEYLDGTDLAAALAASGQLPQAEVIDIGEAVADALSALAHVGIVHRDVKPGNIMLCRDGTTKLTDFGIAKIVGFDTVTATGQLPLTMAYAAPEVWDGTATASSDLYALGVVLLQCLTGKLPFAGTYSQVYRGHMSKKPDLGQLPADTTPALRALIDSCLAKDPLSRPLDADAVVAQLQRARAELEARRGAAGGHQPVAFGPWELIAPHPTRPWAWAARNDKSGQRAIVEVLFSPSPDLGNSLRKAVDANPELVDHGAECLLGTNRLILRPDEAWPEQPPSGPFAFWVAREELPVPPPVTLGSKELTRVVAGIGELEDVARSHGVALDLGPTALVTLPDGSIHVRRPGLPPDSDMSPDAAALDSIRRMPLDLALTKTVARAKDLAELRRDLGIVDVTPDEWTATTTLASPTVVLGSATAGAAQPSPAPRLAPVPAPQPRAHRRRRALVALFGATLILALAALAAFGAFMATNGHNEPSPSAQMIAAGSVTTVLSSPTPSLDVTVGPNLSGTDFPGLGTTDKVDATPRQTTAAAGGGSSHGPTAGPTQPPAAGPTQPPTAAPTQPPTAAATQPPTAPPTPTPVLAPSAPSAIQANATNMTSIWIGWSYSGVAITGFYLQDNAGTTVTLGPSTTSYAWTVTAGTNKCFQVAAYNSAGQSSWNGWACATTPTPTPPPTPCYRNGGAGVIFYSNTGYGGSQQTVWNPNGSNSVITNLGWQPKSFSNTNNAWHVTVYAGPNGTGNPTLWENVSQSDISNLGSQNSTGQWSVKVYVNGC